MNGSFNNYFDPESLRMIAVAKRGAVSKGKPAITCYMVALAIILNLRDLSSRIFSEMQLSKESFQRLAFARIEQMPTVPDPSPRVDDELCDVVMDAAQHDNDGQVVAGSVTAESLLRRIVSRHREELQEYSREHEQEGASEEAPSNRSSEEILDTFSVDWTALASRGDLSPVIGREKELKAMERSLLRKTKNNPVLVGDAGTGKTAIVEGFAVKVAKGEVPEKLRSKKILALDFISLLRCTGLMGFKAALSVAVERGDIIFIDEIHTLMQLNGTSGLVDTMKPFLARGELKLIGATTAEEYSRFIDSDKAFERRLQRIEVDELSVEDTIQVLKGIRESFERYHGIKISDEALESAAELSQRYISNRCQPDKSIDLVDEAATKVLLSGRSGPVEEDDIRDVLSERTGIPARRISQDDASRYLDIERRLGAKVLGQEKAVSTVAKAIRRNGIGLSDPGRPIGSFLFLGPTGVGKTELAKAIADELMGDPASIVRFDMSEYQQSFSVTRLIGSPPGYVGYASGGQLTEVVRRRPYSVILLDEVEKASRSVFELFLQVLDGGRLTDGRGRTVDFSNTVIIMTSNFGSRNPFAGRRMIGFGSDTAPSSMESGWEADVKRFFAPEFLNRLDAVVHFNSLDSPLLLDIARKMLSELKEDLLSKGFMIDFDESVADHVVSLDANPEYGARPVRRAIESGVSDVIADMILSGEIRQGVPTVLKVSGGILKKLQS